MSFQRRFAKAQANFIYTYAGWIASAIILISLASFPFASKLRLKANLLDLLPKSMPSVTSLNQLTTEVGGTSFLIAVIESHDEETARLAAEQFSEQAEKFELIDYVDNRTDISAFKDRKLLFLNLESLKQLDQKTKDLIGYYRRKVNPFLIDLLDEKPPTLDPTSFQLEKKVYAIGGFAQKERNSFMRVV